MISVQQAAAALNKRLHQDHYDTTQLSIKQKAGMVLGAYFYLKFMEGLD